MVKTREFGQPCAAPQPGRCRICRRTGDDIWADETGTLCVTPGCVAEARKELTTHPAEADALHRPFEGTRYGFAPRRR